jgi:ribonuclease BN (tRNA processing enzyme)
VRLTVLGCSPSFPNPGGHCSSYLIDESQTRIVIDCGHGSAGALRAVSDLDSVSAIVLSHMHPDHFFDLVPLRYAYRAENHASLVPLWVPPNGAAVLSSLLEPLGLPDDFFTGTFDLREYDPQDALTIGSLLLRFTETRHYVPGYAILITPANADHPALFFSSDTGWLDDLEQIAFGADLALIEATQTHQDDDREPGHLTGSMAGKLAQQGRVERLLITHYPASRGQELLAQARGEYGGPVELASEGRTYEI